MLWTAVALASLTTPATCTDALTLPELLATEAASTLRVAVDLDGDGDLDLLFGFPMRGWSSWSENQGAGRFGPTQPLGLARANGRVNVPPQLASQPPQILTIQASEEHQGMTTYLDAEGVDPDGQIVLWEWDFESDGTFDHASGVGPGAFHTYPAAATYQATLRATDNSGLEDLALVDVTVVPPSAVTVTDADGNVYQTVTIGNQTWMLENLKTTRLNDGTPITQFTFGMSWSTSVPFYLWADTSDLQNGYDPELPHDYYGAIYNEGALASGKLAPSGWRIPSEQDWQVLLDFLALDGFPGEEALALKSTFGWSDWSGNGTDAYGFRALPGGYASAVGGATGAPVITSLASTSKPTASTRTSANLLDNTSVGLLESSFWLGLQVRCIKD